MKTENNIDHNMYFVLFFVDFSFYILLARRCGWRFFYWYIGITKKLSLALLVGSCQVAKNLFFAAQAVFFAANT